MLLEAIDVTKTFGALTVVNGVSVSLNKGDILGLIGPNGAGKSTFFNCLTGDLMPTSGRVILNGEDVSMMTPEQRAVRGLARSFQVPQTFETMSVLENVMIGAFLRTSDPAKARRRAYEVLDLVGLADVASAVAGSLGTPGRKRLEIARALATDPEILLLDEAMAGLTATEVRHAIELVRKIHQTGMTLVIVEHIMEVIISLAQQVIVFHQGYQIAHGTPQEVTRDPAVVTAYLGKRAAATAARGFAGDPS